MSTPERIEVARLLLIKAAADLGAARLLAQSAGQDDGVIGFHAQQAVEKALKAVLVVEESEIPRTYDLEYLAETLQARGGEVPSSLAAIAWLNPWAVTMRYDEVDEPLDRHKALEAADAATAWARAFVDARGTSGI